jgi:hypothetical protein
MVMVACLSSRGWAPAAGAVAKVAATVAAIAIVTVMGRVLGAFFIVPLTERHRLLS